MFLSISVSESFNLVSNIWYIKIVTYHGALTIIPSCNISMFGLEAVPHCGTP